MKKVILLLSLCVALFADPYTKCVACHGANGEKVALGKSKVIKDMTKKEILTALTEYKKGTRNSYGMGALMKGQVASLSDNDMKIISEKVGK